MKKFAIEIINQKLKKKYGILFYVGQITINDFKESFIMPQVNWTEEDYKRQWKEGLERLKTTDTSCLVSSFQNSEECQSIEMWTLYKKESIIFIHNQLLISETVEGGSDQLFTFNVKTCYSFINPRITDKNGNAVNEDNEKISEWSVDLDVFNAFHIV